MLNKAMIIGRLGADPETRYTQGGQAVCRFRLATSSSYTDRSSGQRVEQTEWHSIVTFGKTAENCGQYLHKGSLAYVEGSLTTRKWQDKNGQERFTTEIKADRVQFLDRKEGSGQKPTQQRERRSRKAEYENEDLGPAFPSETPSMDDIPFS